MNNILFIMMDQWRYDAMGCMGKFPIKTPNIDRLVAGGTTFNNAYCTDPVCVPARASVMTGVYAYDHGVYYNDQNWPDSLPTWADKLAQNCYYTTLVGKTHFCPPRKAAGFQKILVEEDYKENLQRLGLAKPRTPGKPSEGAYLNKVYPLEPTHIPLNEYEPVFFTNRALHELDLIGRRRECRPGGNEPFAMKLSFLLPHSPCVPPEPYFSMYQPEDLPPPVGVEQDRAGYSRQLQSWHEIWSQLDWKRALKHRAQYFGCVTLLDEQIGRVLRKLEELQLIDNTLIILTADHGDYLCDHRFQQKGFFHDCSARVPFIFNGPGVPVGRQVRENVSHIDLFPTLLDYCGLAMPRLRDPAGRLIYADQCESEAMSLLPYFAGTEEPVAPERVIIAEQAMHGQRFMLKQGAAKFNYYLNPDGNNEHDYFDLASDPDELNNRGRSFALDDLSPAMRQAFDRVLEKSARHAAHYYYYQNKIRPVFT
ncbi:MAG: sulfatase [Kiritimatiellia bacterium]